MNSEFEEVLAEYLLAADAGVAIPEEEWLARHPEWQDELAAFLETRSQLNAVVRPLRAPLNTRFPRPFGAYTLLEQIGSGGMGVVYRARSEGQQRDVALKLIRDSQLAKESDRVRFRTEIAAAGRLSHPALTPVFDAGEVDGQPYYTMPLLLGGDMVRSRHRFLTSPQHAAAIVAELARGIDEAHRAGVLHRDLKPSNILFDTEGRPHITDFGLAKLLVGGEDITKTGNLVGTPGYAAPECLSGSAITISADIYGLGGLLYFALTGRPPIEADTVQEILEAAIDREPKPPSHWNSAVPRDLDAIALQCLAKHPTRRYNSAAALADDLDRFLSGRAVNARRPGTVERMMRSARRYPMITGLLTCIILLIGLTVRTAWQRYDETRKLNIDLTQALERESEQLDRMQQFNYASRLNYAADFLQAGRIEDASEILNSLRPRPGEPDLREFSWHYLWRTARCQVSIPTDRYVFAVAISPDERFIASVSGTDTQKNLILHDAESGFVIRESMITTFVHHVFTRLGFLPDSSHVYLGSPAESEHAAVLHLWEVGSGKWVSELTLPMAILGGVDSLEDGSLRLFGGSVSDGIGRILRWKPFEGTFQEEHRDPGGIYFFARPSPRGYFVGRTPCKNGEWQNLTQIRLLPRSDFTESDFHFQVSPVIIDADLSPDGRHLAAADVFGNWLVWDTVQKKESIRRQAIVPEQWGYRLRWFDGGRSLTVSRRVVPGGPQYAVDSLRLSDRTVSTRELDITQIRQMARNAGATMQVYASGGTVRIRRIVPEPSIDIRAHAREAWSVDFSPDGQTLASSSDDNTAILYDLPSGKVCATLKGHPSLVTVVAFAPDGKDVYTAGWDGTVRGWSTVTGLEVSQRQAHSQPINRMALSPDGRWLATAGRDKKLVIWDRRRNEVRHTIDLDYNRSLTLAFSANSTTLTVTCLNEMKVFELESGQSIDSLPYPSEVVPLAKRLDSGDLILGNRWGRLTLTGADRRELYSIPAHTTNILALAVSPDGQTVATGCLAGNIQLWHRATGRQLVELRSKGSQVNGLAFSPDGRYLAAADHTGKVTLWPSQYD